MRRGADQSADNGTDCGSSERDPSGIAIVMDVVNDMMPGRRRRRAIRNPHRRNLTNASEPLQSSVANIFRPQRPINAALLYHRYSITRADPLQPRKGVLFFHRAFPVWQLKCSKPQLESAAIIQA